MVEDSLPGRLEGTARAERSGAFERQGTGRQGQLRRTSWPVLAQGFAWSKGLTSRGNEGITGAVDVGQVTFGAAGPNRRHGRQRKAACHTSPIGCDWG